MCFLDHRVLQLEVYSQKTKHVYKSQCSIFIMYLFDLNNVLLL